MSWEDRERNKITGRVHELLARGRTWSWWSSHGGVVLHRWWCSSLLNAPGVRPEPAMERLTVAQVVAHAPRGRLCGWCVYQKDR